MAHVANVVVKNTWEDLEDLISTELGETFSFDSSKNYYLVNDSNSSVYVVNQATEPDTAAPFGVPLAKNEEAGMVLSSGKIYVATEYGTANLHVEEGE